MQCLAQLTRSQQNGSTVSAQEDGVPSLDRVVGEPQSFRQSVWQHWYHKAVQENICEDCNTHNYLHKSFGSTKPTSEHFDEQKLNLEFFKISRVLG